MSAGPNASERGALFEREIREQPDVLARQLQDGRPAAAAAAAMARRAPDGVVIAARGSSDNAARYAQYLFGAHNRLLVTLAAPSLFTLYDAPPALGRVVVIGISQSGRSPDIVRVLEIARAQGALGLALTADTSSALAGAADLCIPLASGSEHAVAASKSYTAELAAIAMLSAALTPDAERQRALASLPILAWHALALHDAARHAAARLLHIDRWAVIGRGFNYATAHELSLKLQETSGVAAQPHSSADFRHGPVAALDAALGALLVAPTGRAHADVASLLDVCVARGACPLVLSDAADLVARAAGLVLPTCAEWLSPFAATVAGQLFALELARASSLDPDRPRGLSKVTETL
jgi:glucosamine--fructose-6-phosphate aminotransferase (isomerizing)